MAQLVIALDYTSAEDALRMASSLRGAAPWMKVGMELFTREGPHVVETLGGMGFKVMLDLKFFDIPNTVRGGVRAAARIHADMLTVHLLGGERMCRAAVEEAAAQEHRPMIFGVTVLTSLEQGELPGFGDISALATGLAAKAQAWGLDGVVCSGHEVEAIKKAHPGLKGLTPGIRPAGSGTDDQRRIVTPEQAVASGSDFLVVGRPVTQAPDPAGAARAILDAMRQV